MRLILLSFILSLSIQNSSAISYPLGTSTDYLRFNSAYDTLYANTKIIRVYNYNQSIFAIRGDYEKYTVSSVLKGQIKSNSYGEFHISSDDTIIVTLLKNTMYTIIYDLTDNIRDLYDVYYISDSIRINASYTTGLNWIRADTLRIPKNAFKNQQFEAVIFNKKGNKKTECNIRFMNNGIYRNNQLVTEFQKYLSYYDPGLNIHDTLQWKFMCCPAECTNGINKIESAVMIVYDKIAGISSTNINLKLMYDFEKHIISSQEFIDNGKLFDAQGKIEQEFEAGNMFHLKNCKSGIYFFKGYKKNEGVTLKVNISE